MITPSWVHPSSDILKLKQAILQADVCLSDLDGTDAESPAKYLAKLAVGIRGRYVNPRYVKWVVGSVGALTIKGRGAESERWKLYVDNFLRNEKTLGLVGEIITPDFIDNSLFPGVESLYKLIVGDKFYFTRNIETVAKAYAQALGFNGTFSEVFDKPTTAERFVAANPQYKTYLIRGDSEEDQEMLLALRRQVKIRSSPVELVTGIYVCKRGEDINLLFDINTSRNQNGLVNLLI